jgi:hypothetical protein
MTLDLLAAEQPETCPHPHHSLALVPSEPGGWCVDCRGWWAWDRPDLLRLRFVLVLPRVVGAAARPAPAGYTQAALDVALLHRPSLMVADVVEDLVRRVRREFTTLTGRDE